MKPPKPLEGIADLVQLTAPKLCPPCVYFLVSHGEVVYVGQSKALLGRIQTHYEDKTFDAVFYIPTASEQLNEVEAKYIFQLKPKHNRAAPGVPPRRFAEKVGRRLPAVARERQPQPRPPNPRPRKLPPSVMTEHVVPDPPDRWPSIDDGGYMDTGIASMVDAGIPPALIHAFRVTERLVTSDNEHLVPPDELEEWDDAIREGELLYGAVDDFRKHQRRKKRA